ncbi:hypothetical protein PN483_06040 [Nodularia spumigena CS-591/04]|uniref:hypothetical protein n=1 Tax=Nodularia spumigena TaxID=70799 RepID=UPI00232EC864|nr:hypothetical protein [Nodularia spumigena]MDB9322753.1 hypothetical protein [Nodularia spumigena CS-591/07A]MDB9330052.1 hypothetical protein [Nodularia spumigena CS-591/04]MDB9360661.1 hypothetical protein [Nodularia spumigena CS-588/02]MDB9365377.1 hypothetical protein [Nodularia spumigena CS-588/02A10]
MSDNSEGANWSWLTPFFVFILKGIFSRYGWNFIFLLIFIVAIIWLIVFLLTKKSPNNSEQISQRQSTPQESPYPSNQTRNNSSSVNASPNIQWTDSGTYSSNNSQVSQQNNIKFDNFIDLSDATANTEELISNLIGQKDRVTGDVFNSGEKVYFCVPCQLGYHEDSWQFLDRKCEQCKSANVNTYTLTVSRVTQQPLTISKPSLKELKYLMSQLNQFNDHLEAVHLVKYYNEKLVFFDIIVVSEAENSQSQRWIGGQVSPIFERNNRGRGAYWIIDNKYLVPKIKFKINKYSYNCLLTVFETINYGDKALEDNFIFLKPAKMKYLEGKNEWQLQEKGIIIFEKSIQKFIKERKNNSIQFNKTYNLTTSSRNKVTQEYISALDLETIRRQFGNIITIEGQIRSVRVDHNYNIIYFDFAENTYQGFYAYVIRDKCNDFLIPTNYEGKNVIVSGRLTINNRNQPRIRLNSRSQMIEVET